MNENIEKAMERVKTDLHSMFPFHQRSADSVCKKLAIVLAYILFLKCECLAPDVYVPSRLVDNFVVIVDGCLFGLETHVSLFFFSFCSWTWESRVHTSLCFSSV